MSGHRFWPPNDSKLTAKTALKQCQKMHRCLIPLGPVLDLSSCDVGPHLWTKTGLKHLKFNVRANINMFEQISLQDAFLAQVCPTWGAIRNSKRAQNRSNTSPTSSSTSKRKNARTNAMVTNAKKAKTTRRLLRKQVLESPIVV